MSLEFENKIICGDCLELMKQLPDGCVDLVVTDPPYGINKADWDSSFTIKWLAHAARLSVVMGIIPGIANLLSFPKEIKRQKYRWTLVAYLSNSMTRSPFGYGKWIACLVYTVDGVKLYNKGRDLASVIVREKGETMPDHPCPKPNQAMRYFISSLPGNLVLDPFMGSGTTAVACKQLGRRFIGFEISPEYCKIAEQRLAQEVMDL